MAAGADPATAYQPCPGCQARTEAAAAALLAATPTRWDGLLQLTPALLFLAMLLLLAAAVGS